MTVSLTDEQARNWAATLRTMANTLDPPVATTPEPTPIPTPVPSTTLPEVTGGGLQLGGGESLNRAGVP
jgi:hypothetical protein